ncbi:hypothetical protein HK104_002125 [Borealophlyctis nickersoniae]|nr:hypothetical protein HK104_002125 [Borealophlyctis nickersoniae]
MFSVKSIIRVKHLNTSIAMHELLGSRMRDPQRRWKTLTCARDGMTVNRTSGEVTLYPKKDLCHGSVSWNADRGVYIKDSLVKFLCDANESGKGKIPTKYWGSHLMCGRTGGHGFDIRYDTVGRRWYIQLHYDAMVRGAPFRPEAIDAILQNETADAQRARRWIMRWDSIYGGEGSNGNLCSIDPGVRTPWTCYDAHRRSFYDVYPDMVHKLADLHNDIALLQHRRDTSAPKSQNPIQEGVNVPAEGEAEKGGPDSSSLGPAVPLGVELAQKVQFADGEKVDFGAAGPSKALKRKMKRIRKRERKRAQGKPKKRG